MEIGRSCRARWQIAAETHNLCVLISVAKPLPQKISRTTLKSLNFSQKVTKYEKKVNTGKFGKGKYIYIYFTNNDSIKNITKDEVGL